MFVELLIATIIGIFIGIFTGLTPGIHVNLVSLVCLSSAPFLLRYVHPLSVATFIISLSVTHTFLDFVPSVFLGAPEDLTALSILPGHKMLLKGEAYTAVKLTVMGSLFALIFCIILFPLTLLIVEKAHPIIKDYIGWLLVFTMFYMILKDEKWYWNLTVFFLSGCLGLIVLNLNNMKDPLFPLLSGLFGVSTLVLSLSENIKIPDQKIDADLKTDKKAISTAVVSSTIAGFLTSFFPGLGPSQGSVVANELTKDLGENGFLVLVGGIGTVNFVLSLSTLLVIDRARNGAIIVISKFIENISAIEIVVFLSACLIAGGIATVITLYVAKIFSKLIQKVNYKKLVMSIIILLVCMAFYFSSFLGLYVLILSTIIGIIPAKLGVGRSHCMGCLILPVI